MKFSNKAYEVFMDIHANFMDLKLLVDDAPSIYTLCPIRWTYCGKEYNQELDTVSRFYGDDFNICDLDSQSKTFKVLYNEKTDGEQPCVRSMRSTLQSLSGEQRGMLDMVCRGLHILLVTPATNCTSERSFSALRRIKTYSRSTMSQARLNHLLLLHYHQELADPLDMKQIGNDFISSKDACLSIFAKFT